MSKTIVVDIKETLDLVLRAYRDGHNYLALTIDDREPYFYETGCHQGLITELSIYSITDKTSGDENFTIEENNNGKEIYDFMENERLF